MVLALAVYFANASKTAASAIEGTVVSEKSVDCGPQKKGHKKTLDLLCWEYVIHTSTVEYHVRQAEDASKKLLPVNRLNGKKYEYRVVSERSLETKSDARSQ
jgi:hypothetical protein